MHVEPSRYESHTEASLPPGFNRVALLCACLLAVPGCDGSDFVQVDTEGDRIIFTDPVAWGLSTVLALAMLALGMSLIVGRLRFKGRPRVVGVILTILGLCFAFYAIAVAPYAYMAIDSRQLIVQSGPFGQTKTTVDLGTTKAIEIDHVGRSRPRKKGARGSRTRVQFTPHQGESQTINMGGNIGKVVLSHLLKMAPDLGIEVSDRR